MSPQATVVLPAPELVPAMTTRGIIARTRLPALPGHPSSHDALSPLDPLLRADALVHRVLDLHDLRDEFGELDELRRGVAAGDDDVLEAGPVAQRRDDVVHVDPAPLQRVRDLVEQEELVALLRDRALDLSPALACEVGGLGEVARQPRPAVAHLLPIDPAQSGRGLRLADLPLAGLHELKDAAAVPARPRAHEHPERRRALALAMPGDDDDERAVTRLAALGLRAAAVARTVRHVDALGAVAGQRGVGGVCHRERPPSGCGLTLVEQ